jgi:hypothetical protein
VTGLPLLQASANTHHHAAILTGEGSVMLAVAELIDMSMMPAHEYQDFFPCQSDRNPLYINGLRSVGAVMDT